MFNFILIFTAFYIGLKLGAGEERLNNAINEILGE